MNMDLPWGDERSQKFITNVGLITSDGPHGPNVMAVEWTHHISYSPGLIAICLGFGKATLENIRKTKEFGVSITARDQNVLSSISGNYTGKEYDKISALKNLGFGFYKAKKIKAPMVEGAAMSAECKLVKEIVLGDHVMLIGKIVHATASEKEPLAYYKGRYWLMTTPAEKPSQGERDRIRNIMEKYRKT